MYVQSIIIALIFNNNNNTFVVAFIEYHKFIHKWLFTNL